MSFTQQEKAHHFRALHQGRHAFVIANAWDAGSARVLAGLGFTAIATSSGAAAGVLGRRDGSISRDEALAHCRAIVSATDLPVSADLENGFGDAPSDAAKTILMAAEAGLVGGSIEDFSGNADAPLYPLSQAVERVAAAVEAARSLPFPFTLTARSENYLRGNPDLDDTIARLQAFDKAGADVLFAPGPARPGRGARGLQRRGQARQLHGGHQGQVVQRRAAAGRGRAAHQPATRFTVADDGRSKPPSAGAGIAWRLRCIAPR